MAFFSDGLIIVALWIIYNDFFVTVIPFQKQVKGLKTSSFHPYYATMFFNFCHCEMLCNMDVKLQNEWKLKKWWHGMDKSYWMEKELKNFMWLLFSACWKLPNHRLPPASILVSSKNSYKEKMKSLTKYKREGKISVGPLYQFDYISSKQR